MAKTSSLACLAALFVLLPSAKAQVMKFAGCPVDLELIDLPKCSVVMKNGHLYVLKEFAEYVLSHRQVGIAAQPVIVEGRHLASASLPGAGWAYFDRTGRVLVQNVATMDNGADMFHHGLVIVAKGNKWGLADSNGKLIVPMRFDGLLYDEVNSAWIGCSGCRLEAAGKHSWLTGGTWVRLDKRGRVAGTVPDPMVPKEK